MEIKVGDVLIRTVDKSYEVSRKLSNSYKIGAITKVTKVIKKEDGALFTNTIKHENVIFKNEKCKTLEENIKKDCIILESEIAKLIYL